MNVAFYDIMLRNTWKYR